MLGGIAVIALIAFVVMRNRRRQKAAQQTLATPKKGELAGPSKPTVMTTNYYANATPAKLPPQTTTPIAGQQVQLSLASANVLVESTNNNTLVQPQTREISSVPDVPDNGIPNYGTSNNFYGTPANGNTPQPRSIEAASAQPLANPMIELGAQEPQIQPAAPSEIMSLAYPMAASSRAASTLPMQSMVAGLSSTPAVTTDTTSSKTSTTSNHNAVNSSKLLITTSDIEIDTTKPPIGDGSFGVVYSGLLKKSVPVAVKLIKGAVDPAVLRSFEKEVSTWEGLVQKNSGSSILSGLLETCDANNHLSRSFPVLPLMAYCLDPPMLITDLMDQGNLRQYLAAQSWPSGLGLKLLLDVASGMAYLHANGIVHGDLKSLNVMVDENRALIADFGLSKVRKQLGSVASSGTASLSGTPAFVAPEMLAGQSARPPADVYAFAMVCYEVLSKGRYPFDDQPSIAALLYKVAVAAERPDRPEGVDDRVWQLVEQCWAQDPQNRPDFVTVRDRLTELVKELGAH